VATPAGTRTLERLTVVTKWWKVWRLERKLERGGVDALDAMKALGEIGNRRSVELLIRKAKYGDAPLVAARALAASGSSEAVEFLIS
jgi:PBS lyase HEAT-like repeat